MKIACTESISALARDWIDPADWVLVESMNWDQLLDLLNESEVDGFCFPLDHMPYNTDASKWVAGAVSQRLESKVALEGPEWVQGQLGWLPLAAEFAAATPSTRFQFHQFREDLNDSEDAGYRELLWWEKGSDRRLVHPAELVPPAGSGCLVLVLRKDDLQSREWAVHLHQNDVSILTNIERKYVQDLPEGHAALAERDRHGRYHFYFTYPSDNGLQIGHLCQDTWSGLLNSARKFASS